ncbi:LAFA_0D13586g1_1 [Lachancea sp. 'fantastica']|nr:LAFA_0D13586g1_1 [Lachancea sp. 'fantastica']
MGSFTEFLGELKEAFVPTVAEAADASPEQPSKNHDNVAEPEVNNSDDGDEESKEEESGEAEEEKEGGDEDEEEEDEDEDEDDEDEEEEEEVGDQMDQLREECKNKEDAKPLVHHYMECVERVHKAQEDPGYADSEHKEDCVEEFFHLQHHLDGCVAPRLFDRLK